MKILFGQLNCSVYSCRATENDVISYMYNFQLRTTSHFTVAMLLGWYKVLWLKGHPHFRGNKICMYVPIPCIYIVRRACYNNILQLPVLPPCNRTLSVVAFQWRPSTAVQRLGLYSPTSSPQRESSARRDNQSGCTGSARIYRKASPPKIIFIVYWMCVRDC